MPPRIHITDAAAEAIRRAADADRVAIRIAISAEFQYGLNLDTASPDDTVVEANGIDVLLDPSSASRADGLALDFEQGPDDGGFTIENPNAPRGIQQLSPEELKAMMDAGEAFELIDVRTPAERLIAAIEGSRLLDQAVHDELMAGDRATPIVFQCHHGARSQAAAEYFQRAGFTRLYNLAGGIDAWTLRIDPSLTRY
jgi:monothiol glutaredoxin